MEYQFIVSDSIEYIDKNLNNDIRLEDLAKKACLSKYHYHRLFHKAIGEPLNKYVTQKRMESAAKELVTTDHSLIDIALKYQYGSQEAFSRAFKKTIGVTPGQYRKRYVYQKKDTIFHLRTSPYQIYDMAA